MKSLRSAYTTLSERGIAVAGVSMDAPAKNLAFCQKFKLPFPLLSDPEGEACKAFDVEYRGTRARRTTFLFQNGRLVWRDDAVNPPRQAKDVLTVVDALEGRR